MEHSTQLRCGGETLGPDPRHRAGGGLLRGAALGRYVVLERLGAGGMGAVYAAFDPQLDRRVALKVLHAELAEHDPTGSPRLLREAQAMARLTHPNVVTVHDVGVEDDQLFVAMELVDGDTLKRWCADPARTPAQRLEMCIAAGRGLAAAHAEDLVHRDFKPDNVMVAVDGRVLVMDFGLARGSDGSEIASSGNAFPLSSESGTGALTQTGTLLGTPAYMSPEQFAGDLADARSDQFAFCVTTWEALYGERPFSGDSLASLAAAVRAAELRDPPRGRRIASAIRVALTKGLSADPHDRFESMQALLAVLLRAARGHRTQWLASAGVVAVGGGAAVALMSGASLDGNPCPNPTTQVAEHWNEARAGTIARAFEDTNVRYAASTWARTREQLDDYFTAWMQTHQAVCSATHVAHEQSAARLDLRMDCLADGLRQANATLTELSTADTKLVPRAADMVAHLPSPTQCGTTTRPTDDDLHSDGDAPRLAAARQRMASAKARLTAGRNDAALAAATQGLAVLQDVHAPRLRVKILQTEAEAEYNLGQLEPAELTLRQALSVATAASQADQEAGLWLTLMHVVGDLQKQPTKASAYQLPAQLAAERADLPGLNTRLARTAGQVAAGDGRSAEAIEHYEAALALGLANGTGTDSETITRNNLSNALFDVGRYVEALAQMQRVHAADLARYGPDHPKVAQSIMNLARIHDALGSPDEARREYERAIALNERVLGPQHAAVGNCLLNLGGVEKAAGELELARAHYERALAIYKVALRPDHPYVGFALTNIATVLSAEKKFHEALEVNREALAIVERTYSKDHPRALTIRSNIGDALSKLGRNDEAIAAFEETVALREAANGPNDAGLAFGLLGLAQSLIHVGRATESVAFARRALRLRLDAKASPTLAATARFVVALTELAVGNRTVALVEARQAAETLHPDGPTPGPLYPQIVDWLAEHEG